MPQAAGAISRCTPPEPAKTYLGGLFLFMENVKMSERLKTVRAAEYLACCSPGTLKQSRSTGILSEVCAPRFKKIGRNVVYERGTLDAWLLQFEETVTTIPAP